MADTLPIYSMTGRAQLVSPTEADTSLSARLARIEKIVPYQLRGGSTAPLSYTPLKPTGIVNGQLNVASSNSIIFKGSMAPTVADGLFSCTTTATTITWFWDGTNSSRVFVLRRPDGTTTTIPGSSLAI